MDIKRSDWYGQATISGLSEPLRLRGSIFSITQEFVRALITLSPRASASGAKTISLTLSTQPISEQSLADQKRCEEVLSMLDESLVTHEAPLEGEDAIHFTARLCKAGYPLATAKLLAADSFGYELSADDDKWLTDPQAIRFRAIHSSQTSHDAADPHEVAILESHCRRYYPTYVKAMRLRN